MKNTLITILAFAYLALAQTSVTLMGAANIQADTLRWGDTNDSTHSLRFRGNTLARDSSGTWVTTADSCSKWLTVEKGSAMAERWMEVSYENKASWSNDSSLAKLRMDSRYCMDPRRAFGCSSLIPCGRRAGMTGYVSLDSLTTIVADSLAYYRNSQLFYISGASQIRVCIDALTMGGQATDTTYFRRWIIRSR